uniref:Uncharacterized protein n=1 Tax=Arundo donax TaxID=35708 RepID=A0A0A8Z014_ARUDO
MTTGQQCLMACFTVGSCSSYHSTMLSGRKQKVKGFST